tara:strand:- start:1447 stop:1887 length:441 start_codon:yes stop_codon:yes gene_type:complete
MNKSLYKITGWVLIIVGIIWAVYNFGISLMCPTCDFLDYVYEIGLAGIGSATIFILSFFPGRSYINIWKDESKQNKFTNWSIVLTIIAAFIIVGNLVTMLSSCGLKGDLIYGECYGLFPVYIFGIFPAAFLYAIAVILLLVNKFKK